jgi:hypothetical protein
VKHLLAAGLLLFLMSTDAFAQGTNIHSRLGQSESRFSLPACTAAFSYDALVAGPGAPYLVSLEVLHNGIQKLATTAPGGENGAPFFYSCPVDLGGWGLRAGDVVTFILRIVNAATGETVATHVLYGDVCGT